MSSSRSLPSFWLSPCLICLGRNPRRRLNFCNQMMKLVESAPPVSAMCHMPQPERTHPLVDKLLRLPLFQSILVTQFHHWQPPKDIRPTTSMSQPWTLAPNDSDSDEECFDPPWPSEHEAFCAHPLIQDQVVLEIAAGFNSKGVAAYPMELPKGKMKVVLPGSLRERGEFCLVDVAFMKDPSSITTTSVGVHARKKTLSSSRSSTGISSTIPHKSTVSPMSSGDYRWMVRQTRFHCLNDFV
jgi:hypothetical protein